MPVRKKKCCMKSLLVKVCPSSISVHPLDHLEGEERGAEAGGDVARTAGRRR